MAFQFGVAGIAISASSSFTIGSMQNVSFNITYENAQLRGGTEIFANDTQFFDGAVEGSFEFADIELSQLAWMIGGGSGAYAGAADSGTLTLTGAAHPKVDLSALGGLKLVFSAVSNGITAIITLQHVFIPSLTLDWSRTEYMIPAGSFIAQYSSATGLLTIQQ